MRFVEREEFYRVIRDIQVKKVDDADREKAVRLYCETHAQSWNLQIRSPVRRRSDGQDGRDFVVATACLSIEDMRALRNKIDEFLRDDDVDRTAGVEAEDPRVSVLSAQVARLELELSETRKRVLRAVEKVGTP